MRAVVTAIALMVSGSAGAQAQATAPAPAAKGFDLLPAFVAVCMDHGPGADQIQAALAAMGGQASPVPQDGKPADDPARPSAYLVRSGTAVFSAMFNRVGACSVLAPHVDADQTKASFEQWVVGASGVFAVARVADAPHGAGETVLSSFALTPKGGAYRMIITLSTASRPGSPAMTLISRYLQDVAPAAPAGN